MLRGDNTPTIKFLDDNGVEISCTLPKISGSDPERTWFIVLPEVDCVYQVEREALSRVSVRWEDFVEGHKPPRNNM